MSIAQPIEQALPAAKTSARWRWTLRIVRWSTYLAAFITVVLVLHKTPAPVVRWTPLAAARAEEKIQQVEQSLSRGQPAMLRLDEAELNGYLTNHLALDHADPSRNSVTNSNSNAPTRVAQETKSNVRDLRVQMLDDRAKAYIVFNAHGKDMSLELEGRLAARDGYLRFEPIRGAIGALPIPQSALATAVQRLMDSADNREKLRLPPDIADLRIENGELVATYR